MQATQTATLYTSLFTIRQKLTSVKQRAKKIKFFPDGINITLKIAGV